MDRVMNRVMTAVCLMQELEYARALGLDYSQ
jgi:hypothetical protein